MAIFAAQSDGTRRRIVELLAHREMAAGDVAAHFSCSRPATSQHLKVLREAGLVRNRVDGQRRLYSLDPAGLDGLDEWIATQRRFWARHLDRLAEQISQGLISTSSPVQDLPGPGSQPPDGQENHERSRYRH